MDKKVKQSRQAARRVVVIGGGIIGVCSASWLLRDGYNVTLVEREGIASGSSYGNAGCFNASSLVPMSLPGNLAKVPGWLMDPLGPLSIRWSYVPTITPWLIRFLRAGTAQNVEKQALALGNLLRNSVGVYQPLVQNAQAQSLLRQDGHLIVYPHRSDFEADALAWKLRRDNGIAFTVLENEKLWEREPALSHAYSLGVFLADNGHTTNPGRLVNMLSQAFQRDGGTIVKAAATEFQIDGQQLSGVVTSTGVLPCDYAVVAAGAYSKQFAKGLGDNIPLDTERGYHIVVPPWEDGPRIPVMDTSGKFVATPMEEGLRIAGTVEFAGLDAKPDWKRAHKLLPLGQRLFPGLPKRDPEHKPEVWMGFRPSMPDSLPVIGRSSRSPNIVYAFGHGHIGMAGGAQTGLLISDLVAGRQPRIPCEAFSPQRFR